MQPKSPLEKNDHPEIDESPLLDEDGNHKCRPLIGTLQWPTSLTRFDVATAVMTIDVPKTCKELHSFVGVANYHRDMWIRLSHTLAALAKRTSKETLSGSGEKSRRLPSKWLRKSLLAKQTALAHPDFSI